MWITWGLEHPPDAVDSFTEIPAKPASSTRNPHRYNLVNGRRPVEGIGKFFPNILLGFHLFVDWIAREVRILTYHADSRLETAAVKMALATAP